MAVGARHAADDPVIGIDLGTTNSVVAFCDERGPRVLAPEGGRAIVPSMVRFGASAAGDGGEAPMRAVVEAVGDSARDHAVEFPERTIYSVKRLMGRSAKDAAADLPYLAYDVVEGEHCTARVQIPVVGGTDEGRGGAMRQGVVLSPQEVSAVILRELRDRAAAALGREVRRAVVTVPAYFDDAQRQATRDAGRLAGLEVVRIVNEPTAAALAYGIGFSTLEPQTIAVFDLGGGTFDVSVLALTPTEAPKRPTGSSRQGTKEESAIDGAAGADFFEVLSTAGDTHLGGDDVDQMLVRLIMEEIGERFGTVSLGAAGGAGLSAATRQAMRSFAETMKIRLSTEESATVRVDIGPDERGAARMYERTMRREEFEGLIRPWAQRAIDMCRRALRDAKLRPGDIDRVVMVGGSTRIPLVRRMVGEFFGTDPYTALDPDLVVALGAAVQASIVSGMDRSRLLLDVIPLSLGVETIGGAVAKLIMRNQTVPARATEMFTTSVDGQTSIRLHVLQGEREMAADCRSLGEFHLRGLPPMPAGVPQLEVEFLVDANGVLNVSAVERRSGKRAALQVVPNHGLTREEVDRMEAASFAHAREDMERHRVVDLIANARLDVKWTREGIGRVGDLLNEDYRAQLQERVATLNLLIERAESDWRQVNADEFHRAKEELDRASMRMHEISITESLKKRHAAGG